MKAKDLTGKRFGKLTVISKVKKESKSERTKWLCKCDCGNTTIVPTYRLTGGETQSCGCKRYESKNMKHGMKNTRIYSIWCDMKKRCNNPNSKNYKNYGARGIKVCDEWSSDFMSFYSWSIKNGYKGSLSIDRIDNDKGYSPDNCRWVTRKEQNNNRRNTVFVEIDGKSVPLSFACEKANAKRSVIWKRIRNSGMTFDEAIEKGIPEERNHYEPIDKKLVEKNGLKYKTVWMRINACGWDEEKALTTPVHHSRSYHPKPLSRPDKNSVHPSPNGLGSKDKP